MARGEDGLPGGRANFWNFLRAHPELARHARLFDLLEEMDRIAQAEGGDGDTLSGARGRFGWDPANPVPCWTLLGAEAYLSQLRTPEGAPIAWTHVDTLEVAGIRNPVDVYALRRPDGAPLGHLHVSAYQRRNSRLAPEGLRLVE